jgi:hypothetical protein
MRWFFRVTFASLLMLAMAPPSFADVTGAELLRECTDADAHSDDRLACATYFYGFLDGAAFGSGPNNQSRQFCPPENIDVSDAQSVFKKFASTFPSELHEAAGPILAVALARAYPCAGK